MREGPPFFHILNFMENLKHDKSMKTNSKIQEKRNELRELSKIAKALVKEGAADRVNDALKMMYFMEGHDELNTLQQWNKKGYMVKKGEKALLLWGEPKRRNENKEKQSERNDENEENMQFFPICYVFSNKQVTESKKGGVQ